MATSNEFGPTCRYKDGDHHVCNTPEELAEYEDNGWKDTPTNPVDDNVIDVVEDKKPAKKTSWFSKDKKK